jgi:Holliday junction resolvase RusA-like endonuclease
MTAGAAPLPGEHFMTLDVRGRPASYSTAGTPPWKEAVRAAVASAGMESAPVTCRFAVRIEFRTPVPSSTNEVRDLDNLIKPTLDAMEGVVGLRPWKGLRNRPTTASTS